MRETSPEERGQIVGGVIGQLTGTVAAIARRGDLKEAIATQVDITAEILDDFLAASGITDGFDFGRCQAAMARIFRRLADRLDRAREGG